MFKDINHIIARILTGKADVDDIMLFHDWLGQDENNRKEFLQIKEYWKIPVEVHNVSMPEIAFEKCKRKLTSTGKTMFSRHRIWILSVAATVAIFILTLATTYLLQKDGRAIPPLEHYTYLSSDGVVNFILPDGSNIHLNSHSKLTYSSQPGSDERIVHLEGESFFDVAKNGTKFKVVMTCGEIEVTGTKFNVLAYPGDSVIIATTESGSIIFRAGEQQVIITSGQQLSFNIANSVFDLNRVDSNIYTSWKDKIYRYRGVNLKELCTRLEQIYRIKIALNPSLNDVKVSGSFEYQQTIDQILDVMKKSRAFTWKRNGNTIIIQ